MAFELLSEPIRRFIRDKGWEALRPIQAAAIQRILSSKENYILASRTASGKTEAAFLPILSKVNFAERGVQVLYISPLIALINDQFFRVEELCKYLDVTVTKWHGEAAKSGKDNLVKNPSGIILITPESLEAMFVNKPFLVKELFGKLKYVVIDEIHSFIGSDRGVQLKSLLARMQSICSAPFHLIGLSATLGDYEEAKKFTGNPAGTKVLLDRTAKEMVTVFRYFENDKEELPLDLLKNLYLETKDNKVLLFPNSRGRAEEVAVKLKKISDRVGGHANYFSHHSSVDKEVREYVEHFAKNNRRQNFLIACTSTLELGIDIGYVDEVVQIDATHSIASLIQRVGRSGRRDGEKSFLYLYATDGWSLLQSLACYTLYTEGFIEPPQVTAKPYDIFLHQVLSIVKGFSGIKHDALRLLLEKNFAFAEIQSYEREEIIVHLLKADLLEQVGNELIIGVEGEYIVNSREFYSVFKTEESFKVINAGNKIGEVPFTIQIREGENILLAARIWKIVGVDMKGKKVEVVKAKDGKKPQFFGSGVSLHTRIRERMLELLISDEAFDYLDETALDKLAELRGEFTSFAITDCQYQRPLLIGEKEIALFTFNGTRVNRTLSFLLEQSGIKNMVDEKSSSIEMEISKEELLSIWGQLTVDQVKLDAKLHILIDEKPALLDFSKWGIYLPLEYKVRLLMERYFDFEETAQFINQTQLVSNQ